MNTDSTNGLDNAPSYEPYSNMKRRGVIVGNRPFMRATRSTTKQLIKLHICSN